MSDNLCKFVKLRKQITYDGVHWFSTDEYKKGDFLEYECVFQGKFQAVYLDSRIYSEECDSTSVITSADTRPSGYEYSAMTSAVIGDCVTSIEYNAFSGFTNLSAVTIGSGVTSIGYDAFRDCRSLTSITIPSGVTSIKWGALIDCKSLTSITCLATTPPALQLFAFNNTNNCPIYVPCESVEAYKTANRWGIYALRIQGIPPCSEPQYRQTSGTPYCTGVDKYQDVYDQVSYDGGTTWRTTATTSVLIENNSYDCGYRERTTSGTPYCNGYDKYQDVYNEYSTDSGSTWITASTVPTLVEAQSTDCGYVPPFDGKFKAGGYTAQCDGNSLLTTATTRPYGHSYEYFTSAIVGDCVTSIDAFAMMNYSSMTSVSISNSVRNIGRLAFAGCSSLLSVVLPSGLTSIEYGLFERCSSLSSVTIPNGVTNIGMDAFSACTNLSRINSDIDGVFNIPNSVTSISQSFVLCKKLENIIIPSGVTDIGSQAFNSCTSLQSVTVKATTPPSLGDMAFRYVNTNFVIYVPCESVNAYKAASGWSTYASRIQGIPPCYEPQYRQTSGTPYCTSVDKYQDVYDQVSYDGGTSWETTATTSVLIEAQSTDCGYVPPSFYLNSYIYGTHYIRGTLTGTIYGTNGFSSSFEHNGDSATKTLVDNIEGTLRTYGYVMDSKYNTIEPYGAKTKTITITTIEGIIYTITLYIGKGLKGELNTFKNK